MSLKWLPNAVTVIRCILAIIVGYVILQADAGYRDGRTPGLWSFFPFILFTVTAATDWLDGALARSLNAESRFGARLDPIADKLLTASSLFALAHLEGWAWYLMLPAIAIVGRDFLLTAMRESMGNPSTLKVSQAAKWKTSIVLTAIGLVLFGMAVSHMAADADAPSLVWIATRAPLMAGLIGIWAAAVLSIMTAADYISAATKG